MTMQGAMDSYIPPTEVPLLVDYVQRLGLDMSAPITLVFTEAGGGSTELALAKQLLTQGHISCERILLMDRVYAWHNKPVVGDKHIDALVSTYNSYCELTDVLAKARGAVAVFGIHQRHDFEDDIELAEYDAFLHWCVSAEAGGQLRTPYINILDCSRLVTALAAARIGLFEPLAEGSSICVNCRTWDQWHAWMHLHCMHSQLAPVHPQPGGVGVRHFSELPDSVVHEGNASVLKLQQHDVVAKATVR